MKVYKVELLIVDTDGVGEEEIKIVIENQKYPNYCISPHVMDITGKEIEWNDEHPLNNIGTITYAYKSLFENP